MNGGSGSGAIGAHFVYQRVLVNNGRAIRLNDHLRLAERALKTIYNIDTQLDKTAVERHIPQERSATVLMIFEPDKPPRVELERRLLTHGPSHSPLRPMGVTFSYSIPYPCEPTNFQLLSAEFLDDLARRRTSSSARSIRLDGDKLISAGDAALFGIKGHTVFTAPIGDGAMETVERQEVIAAAHQNPRLNLIEQAVPHSELRDFDELFVVDAAGITSFADCDGAKFSALVAPRLLPPV